MRILAIALVAVLIPAGVLAQTPDRSLQRIGLALQRERLIVSEQGSEDAQRAMERQTLGSPVFEALPGRPRLGPFELVSPQLRGEVVRVALPIGSYVSHGFRAVATAKRRRQEATARRKVDAELKAFSAVGPKF